MSLLERAIEIAVEAHNGQLDKNGAPYILHPLRVMLRMESEAEMIVAVLHDVVEDTEWTLDSLRGAGFSTEVLEAIDAVTRRELESYSDYVRRAIANRIARRVKLADLEDNMDLRRSATLTPDDLKRLQKYHKAWRMAKL